MSPYSALSLGCQWIHVGFSLRGVWKNFIRFLREGRRRPFRSADRQGFGHARRGATTGAGLDVQTTAELPQLQFSVKSVEIPRCTARGDATGAVLEFLGPCTQVQGRGPLS